MTLKTFYFRFIFFHTGFSGFKLSQGKLQRPIFWEKLAIFFSCLVFSSCLMDGHRDHTVDSKHLCIIFFQ